MFVLASLNREDGTLIQIAVETKSARANGIVTKRKIKS